MDFINKDSEFNNFVQEVLCNKEKAPFLFVGAGISFDSQLPSWQGFINNCVSTAFKNNISVDELASIHSIDKGDIWLIDAAREEAKKRKITEYNLIYDSLWGKSPEKIKPTPLHFLLIKYAKLMKVPIFTTNYDTLLEEAAKILNITVTKYEKVTSTSNFNKFCIVYLHGRLQKSKVKSNERRTVASKVSYLQDFNNTPKLISEFRDLLQKKSCLFIGTSLKDDNINRCLHFAKVKGKQKHFWFTKLNANSLYKKEIYQDLWMYLNVTPIYCKTKSYDEIKTAFRRAISKLKFIEHSSSNYVPNSANYNQIEKGMKQILKSDSYKTLLKKCLGPFDSSEIDLYLDTSKKSSGSITVQRVWSENTNWSSFKKKAPREFKVPSDLQDDFYTKYTRTIPSLVKESVDSLTVHKFIRTADQEFTSENVEASASNPRAWAYISFPIIVPGIFRCGAIIVLKYMNKNNKLADMENHFDIELHRDIIKLGAYLSDQFNNLIQNPNY